MSLNDVDRIVAMGDYRDVSPRRVESGADIGWSGWVEEDAQTLHIARPTHPLTGQPHVFDGEEVELMSVPRNSVDTWPANPELTEMLASGYERVRSFGGEELLARLRAVLRDA